MGSVGRPPTISAERIVAVGTEITLPAITFARVAKELGVTQPALYKHVSGVDELKRLIAEHIFLSWALPAPSADDSLPTYLFGFGHSMYLLAQQHPGITGFLTRRDDTTPSMVDKIAEHHREVAATYRLPRATAQWLLSTIAFHCVALADTFYATRDGAADHDTGDADREFDWGLKSLILGSLRVLDIDTEPPRGWTLRRPRIH
ncbi:hypothetical protein ABLE92_17630 [Gordonia sp. VNQ95]|jgi:AcrR family transcriptional regulator|uniref:TetR/AcrR family transcriptional regulator n=1 Tax=Gordonia TaxID=2053 RepID=UPI0032B3C6CC